MADWIEPDFHGISLDTNNRSSADPKRRRKFPTQKTTTIKASTSSKSQDDFDPFVQKYEPHQRCDLAVHRKKIEDVENFMRSATIKDGIRTISKILCLTGPSGCGKTATVKVLANELGFRISEWSNNESFEMFNTAEDGVSINYTTQSKEFGDFLLRAEKCAPLTLKPSKADENIQSRRQLIVVEEFPNVFSTKPSQFWDILRDVGRKLNVPLIFIVNDDAKCRSNNLQRLFPPNIIKEFNITSITFNPVSYTSILKVLRPIYDEESIEKQPSISNNKKKPVDAACLQKIAETSNGDIRSAINALQFSITDKAFDALAYKDIRDSSINLFHALGKFLYSKRILDDVTIKTTTLPIYLKEYSRPRELAFDPEDVIDRCGVDSEFFALFLQENYISFVSEMESVLHIAECLSFVDGLGGKWTTKEKLNAYVGSLSGRCVAFNCYDQKLVRTLKAMRKSAWTSVWKNCRKNCQLLRETFEVDEMRHGGSTLIADIIPYLAKLPNHRLRHFSQCQLVDEIGRFPLNKSNQYQMNRYFGGEFQDLDLASAMFDESDDVDIAPCTNSQTNSVVDDNKVEDERILNEIDEFPDD